jgi:aminopeptidase
MKSFDNILKTCMGLTKNESLLIIYDKNKKKIAELILKHAKKISPSIKLIQTPIAKVNGQEPPKYVAKELDRYDVALLVTTKSLSHTKARKRASKKGVRIASMPGITLDIIKRTMSADYKKIQNVNTRILKKFKTAKKIILTTKRGTRLLLFPNMLFNDSGIYKKRGSFGNLPAGEIGFAPIEKKTQGILIIDKSVAGVGLLKKPIKITVLNGFAVKITGGKEATKLKDLLIRLKNKNVYNIAEFAIGTNYMAKITGATLEDEKVYGTVHIALGSNTSYPGGTVNAPSHLDGVVSKPTIEVDGKILMKNGKILF